MTPASATTYRSSAFTSTMRVIRSSESTMLPASAFAPPERPVPAPRGTTGSPDAAARRTTAETSVLALGEHHGEGRLVRRPLGVVVRVGVEGGGIGEDLVGAQHPTQFIDGGGHLVGFQRVELRLPVGRNEVAGSGRALLDRPADGRRERRALHRSL